MGGGLSRHDTQVRRRRSRNSGAQKCTEEQSYYTDALFLLALDIADMY